MLLLYKRLRCLNCTPVSPWRGISHGRGHLTSQPLILNQNIHLTLMDQPLTITLMCSTRSPSQWVKQRLPVWRAQVTRVTQVSRRGRAASWRTQSVDSAAVFWRTNAASPAVSENKVTGGDDCSKRTAAAEHWPLLGEAGSTSSQTTLPWWKEVAQTFNKPVKLSKLHR